MWFTRLAIARPILIWMALAAIAVLGIQAYFRLPAELNPRADIPTLTVTTVYAGAGPPEIETQISKVLEDTVGAVPGVKDVYSSSQSNVSILSMDFQVGTDLDVAIANVRGRLESARALLPPGAGTPVVAKLDINAQPVLYLGLNAPSQNIQQLRSLADNLLRPRLQRVAGVASVQVLGGEQREIHVDVDALKLGANRLTIEDVVNALKAGGRDVPGGAVSQGSRETDVRLSSAFTSLEAVRNTQIQGSGFRGQGLESTGSAGMQGAASSAPTASLPSPPLTVADVAAVTEGLAEQTAINRLNGHESVSLVLVKAPDASAVTVVNAVNRTLAQLQSSLPADFKTVAVRDDGETVSEALSDVNMSLILGALLAVTVILLFLHNLRGTFIVALAIPACIVATFLVMYLANFTLNQMTLLALSLSVGILVDDSIVVLESITRHLGMGKTPEQAAIDGRSEIGFADITTTLVDVVVFVPIGFMGGIVGGFFKQFGLCIAVATLFSLVISFSVTPMLAARWYKQGENLERVEGKRGLYAVFERLYGALEARYRRVIRFALRWRWPVLIGTAGALGLVFALSFSRLGFEFLPGTDQGLIAVDVELPPGSSLNATAQAARQVESAVMARPDVAAVVTNVGQILGGFGSIPQQGAQYAQINARLIEKSSLLDRLHPSHARLRSLSDQDITTQMRRDLQPLMARIGGKISVAAVRSVAGISLPVEIQLRGSDVNQLARFAEQVRDRLRSVPGILDPDVSTRSGRPQTDAAIDPVRAAQFNVPPTLAGAILRDSVAGNTDSVFRVGAASGTGQAQEIAIRVRLEDAQRGPSQVGDLIVGYDAQGQPVRLADVGEVRQETGPSAIERSNGQRLVSVTANLAPDTPLGNVQQRVQREIIDAIPHAGIDVHWGGEAETLDENVIPFASALILAALLVYFVMASLFNNLGTPFVIMFALPMALVGALAALVLTGETLSLIAAIGIVMLVGLMGRNAILLLDYTNTLRTRGLERSEALIEAGATRLRPILMTTTATIAGMLPVALRIGKASEIRAPMAIVVIGGLLVSTLLTLLIIPILYSIYDDWTGRSPAARAADAGHDSG